MNRGEFTVSGTIVDVVGTRIYSGTLYIREGKIVRIDPEAGNFSSFIMPGFIDAHVHIESSMLTPYEFARVAVTHGTVAAVADPHEIANVLGMRGVEFMMNSAAKSPFNYVFGAPSCVPATPFETSGASLGPSEVACLLGRDDIGFLSEVMNYPGVIARDPQLMEKIESASKCGKKIDGHAPGLRGEDLKKYRQAGIETDHETLGLDEALEKLRLGMKILIREGSAAKDLERFHCLIDDHSSDCMFCTDDLHPDDLVSGHINSLVSTACRQGHDLMKVLRCACLNPAWHYNIPVGLLQMGDPADFIVVENLEEFTIRETYLEGRTVARRGKPLLDRIGVEPVNVFAAAGKHVNDFRIEGKGIPANIMVATDGELVTGWMRTSPRVEHGCVVSDPHRDILKIAVVNRYQDRPPALGLVRGFGLKKGAIASSVAHDSHNIVAVGVSDVDLCKAVNSVIEHRGGLVVVHDDRTAVLPLPVAGIVSDGDAWEVARLYSELQEETTRLGSPLNAPFLTLSFMALLVIPHLKVSDKGLFDADRFALIDLFAETHPA
ncbi:MAG: adenine deaminase [Desulfomonilia bacterium]|nr:adenine deaminase [Desulfomonilia bacterium]